MDVHVGALGWVHVREDRLRSLGSTREALGLMRGLGPSTIVVVTAEVMPWKASAKLASYLAVAHREAHRLLIEDPLPAMTRRGPLAKRSGVCEIDAAFLTPEAAVVVALVL